MGWLEDKAAALAAATEPDATNVAQPEPPEGSHPCPTCGASGDDPCVTASGNAKATPHAKRGS